MSFVERQINLIFNLGAGSTFADGSNQASFEGLRISATISKAGSVGMNQLDMRVNGLTPDVANALTTLGKPLTSGKLNSVTVLAGNVGGPLSTAFVGNIMQAWQDFSGAPDVGVTITGQTGSIAAFTPVAPNSYKGPVDVATVIAQLAAAAGFKFENNGCSKIIPNQYYDGDLRKQILTAAKNAGFQCIIDDVNGVETVAIWPVGGSRNYATPDIGGGALLADGTTAPNTGMVGYPAWTENGILVKTLYNPQIIYGANVKVYSQITQANGGWNVFSILHELESQTFNGKWFTTVGCSLLGPHASGGVPMSDTSYPGFATNADGASRFNIMAFIAQRFISRIWTSTIVKVIAVYPSPSFTVDIEPQVNQIDGSGQPWPHTTIYGVPYLYFQGGANAIEIDPAMGDLGIAFFASRDISSVKANKAQSNPGSFRQFDPADAMYFGAFPGLNGAPTQTIKIDTNGVTITSSITNVTGNLNVEGNISAGDGITGSFTTPTGQTVTVQNGIIINLF